MILLMIDKSIENAKLNVNNYNINKRNLIQPVILLLHY